MGAKKIIKGDIYSCGISRTNDLICWSIDTNTHEINIHNESGPNTIKAKDIAVDEEFVCWIENANRHLKCKTFRDGELIPIPSAAQENVIKVSSAQGVICAIVMAGGNNNNINTFGGLQCFRHDGLGTSWPSGLDSNVKSVNVSNTHACVINTIGKLICWDIPLFIPGEEEDDECCVCFDQNVPALNKASMRCGHWVCRECMAGMQRSGRSMVCPQCRTPLV